MAQTDRKVNLWIFGLSLIGLVWANNYFIPLWNADEAAYAGIAKNMLESGNWIAQDFFQSEIHRKPPLHLWGILISYMAFGINDWAVRFPSSLSILFSAWLIFKWVKQEKDQLTGQIAAGVFVSNFLILAISKIAFVDAHLVLASTASGILFYHILLDKHKPINIWVLWVILGIGILIKGPQILIFGGLTLIASHWIKPIGTTLLKLKPWLGIPIMILPISLWAWASYQQDGGSMVRWMWDWYILNRAKGEVVFGQTGPPGYYFGIILVSFLPFLISFFILGKNLFDKGWRSVTLNKYLICWIISGWLIYEFIPSKLPTYAIASFPGWSILLALQLKEINQTLWKELAIRIGVFLQILLLAGISVVLIMLTQAHFGFWGLFLSVLSGLILLVATIVYVLQLESGRFERSGMSLVWGNILFCFILVLPLGNLISETLNGPKKIAEHIKIEVKKSDRILLMQENAHMISVPYYLSKEGQLDINPVRGEAIYQAMNERFKVVIADSSFIKDLNEKYTPVANYTCLDINENRNHEYLIFYRK